MKITPEEVKHVAKLAKLYISPERHEKLTKEMEAIIAFADKLNELDTEGVEPTAHAIPVSNVFREDIVKESYDRSVLLKNAPSADEACYIVPKVVV